MGWPAITVAVVLLVMGLASLTVFIERNVTLRRSRKASQRFAAESGSHLRADMIDEVIAEAGKYEHGYLPRLVKMGLSTYKHARETATSPRCRPPSARAATWSATSRTSAPTSGAVLSVLASVGSVAPFVGLLGTVLGIITAFQGIASSGSGGLSAVSAGISEALIETALGLAVAIPAVLAFNYLTTMITRDETGLNSVAGELLDTIEGWAEEEVHEHEREVKQHGATRSATWWRRRVKGDVTPDMNVTPLVDVVLVLLIIFMVVTPALQQDVQLDLPGIFNPDPQTEGTSIRSRSRSRRPASSHGRPEIRPRGVAQALTDMHIIDPARRVLLRADQKLPYREVRGIMARVQQIGFPGLSFGVGEKHRAGEPVAPARPSRRPTRRAGGCARAARRRAGARGDGGLTMAMTVGTASGGKTVTPTMNVTPLVDVVLVLLIIFMVITPLLQKAFWVHLPKQEQEEVTPEQLSRIRSRRWSSRSAPAAPSR
jgi:biopolymer transport protein ExbB